MTDQADRPKGTIKSKLVADNFRLCMENASLKMSALNDGAQYPAYLHPIPLQDVPESGSLLLGTLSKKERLDLSRDVVRRHVFIVAPDDSEIRQSLLGNNCAYGTLSGSASFIATDIGGQLWRSTGHYHTNAMRFAPHEPESSTKFNWLPLCADNKELSLLLARAVIAQDSTGRADPFWERGAVLLVAALFSHIGAGENPIPRTLSALLKQNAGEVQEALLHSHCLLAREMYEDACRCALQTAHSLLLDIIGSLAAFLNDDIQCFTDTKEAPDFAKLRECPTAVYWCLPEKSHVRYAPLTAVFYTLLIHQLKHTKPTQPITLYLDDFGSCGMIPSLESDITLLRGRDIGIVMRLRALAQLAFMYGTDGARVLLDNIQTKIMLGDFYHESDKALTELMIAIKCPDGPEWTPDDLRRIPQGKMWVWHNSARPAVVTPL